MTIKVSYAQFLTTHGVPRTTADSIAVGIHVKILNRQPLTDEEAALTQLFLSRPGANTIAEQYVAAAANLSANGRFIGFQVEDPDTLNPGSSPPGSQVAPSQIKVILLAPKASRGLSQPPGPPATTTAKERHQGATILTSNMRGSVDVRTLADRVASKP